MLRNDNKHKIVYAYIPLLSLSPPPPPLVYLCTMCDRAASTVHLPTYRCLPYVRALIVNMNYGIYTYGNLVHTLTILKDDDDDVGGAQKIGKGAKIVSDKIDRVC